MGVCMSTINFESTESGLIAKLFSGERSAMDKEAAKYFLQIEFPTADRQRMHDLGEKAQAGTLSPDEEQELDRYLNVTNVLAILKSRARCALTERG
jgi:hypothetical protein